MNDAVTRPQTIQCRMLESLMKGDREVKSKQVQRSGNLRQETRKTYNKPVEVSFSRPRPRSRMRQWRYITRFHNMDTIYEWSSSRPGRSNPLPRKEHGTHWIGNWMRTISGLLPIDQKMIRSRNTIDERAQYFVMNYEFLLPMLKAYTQ